MFSRIVATAALAGLAAGLLLTAIQHFAIAPMIRDAEVREEAALAARPASGTAADAHSHEEAWSPAAGPERLLATAASNIVVAMGFALLLGAAMALRGASGWRLGLAYGVAGYAAMFVAPSLGLPPELPGAESAALEARQLWWAGTAIATAGGLAMIAWCKQPLLRLLGVAQLILPHAVGAPQPAVHASIHPALATNEFVVATGIANLALWVVLGVAFGLLAAGARPRR